MFGVTLTPPHGFAAPQIFFPRSMVPQHGQDVLVVMDPLHPMRNITRSSFAFHQIQYALRVEKGKVESAMTALRTNPQIDILRLIMTF